MTHSGGKKHRRVGDQGQRYEISYYDPSKKRRCVMGWAKTMGGVKDFMNCIKLHPTMTEPEFKDRFKNNNKKG